MKLTLAANYHDFNSLEALLDDIASRGIKHVEMPCGGFCGKAYCNPAELLTDDAALAEWQRKLDERGLAIACLSVQGNTVHPNRQVAQAHIQDFKDCVDLANKLRISTVVAFSGLPGGCPEDRAVSWPVGGITEELYDIYQYQWERVLIPHWVEMAAYAVEKDVKIAIEIHSGMAVHTPHTLLKLRNAVGEAICANVDTGHLWWQGIQPAKAIEILDRESAIGYIHLRDTSMRPSNVDLYGVTGSYLPEDVQHRGWIFSAMGYGHSINEWRGIFKSIQKSAYRGPLSIEYADPSIDLNDGLNGAIHYTRKLMQEFGMLDDEQENERRA